MLRLVVLSILVGLFTIQYAIAKENTPQIHRSLLQEGRYWVWKYSHFDDQTQSWTPYYLEKYTVSERRGHRVTLLMSSRPANSSKELRPHHKLVVNLRKCRLAASKPWLRQFSLTMFTQSLGDGWSLVSKTHPAIAFTEKFNCLQAYNEDRVRRQTREFQEQERPTFQIVEAAAGPHKSWFFSEGKNIQGVAAYKLFQPRKEYKFELIQTGGAPLTHQMWVKAQK